MKTWHGESISETSASPNVRLTIAEEIFIILIMHLKLRNVFRLLEFLIRLKFWSRLYISASSHEYMQSYFTMICLMWYGTWKIFYSVEESSVIITKSRFFEELDKVIQFDERFSSSLYRRFLLTFFKKINIDGLRFNLFSLN